jgi:hypothetical protein
MPVLDNVKRAETPLYQRAASKVVISYLRQIPMQRGKWLAPREDAGNAGQTASQALLPAVIGFI